MSSTESKMVLRVEIRELRGKGYDEAYRWFKSVLGEPDDVDKDSEGKVDYFYYEKGKREFTPVKEYSYGLTDDDKWGLDYLLHVENEYGPDLGKKVYSVEELMAIVKIIEGKFYDGICMDDCKIVSYSWYNGSDEPIEFE